MNESLDAAGAANYGNPLSLYMPLKERGYLEHTSLLPDPPTLHFNYPQYRGICLLQTCLISNRKHTKFPRQGYKVFNPRTVCLGKG